MPVCTKHGEFYKDYCHSCNAENIKLAKESHRADKKKKNVFGRTYKVSEKSNDREKLKRKLQAEWRKVIFPFYEKKGLTSFCWITGKRLINQKGANRLYGAQVSHFYAKSEIWQLWCDPVNSGICSYSANVDNPSWVASMKGMMVKVWGKERVEDLERRAEEFNIRIKAGLDSRYPSEEWMLYMIEECKKMVIK